MRTVRDLVKAIAKGEAEVEEAAEVLMDMTGSASVGGFVAGGLRVQGKKKSKRLGWVGGFPTVR